MEQPKKWQELKREVVFHKYSQTVEKRDYRLPNGKVSDYYLRVEKPGACVLALTVDKRVVTIVQYRPGPNAVLRELPGGQVDESEDPRQAAMRELLEETGYKGTVDDWVGTWQSDAYTEMNRAIIVAKDCTKIAEPELEETEFGKVELVGIPDFLAQVRLGRLTDTAGAMLALDHLGLL